MNQRLSTLNEIEAAVWDELERTVRDRAHPWRTCVLASTAPGADGQPEADARLIVLREAVPAARQLLIYTDSRARKVAQLRARPAATLVMWSAALGWQLRCNVVCDVEHDGLAVSSRWTRIKLSPGAQDYLSPTAPGTPLEGHTPAASQREHFALITATVTRIDWMELNADGHRRAVFGDGPARWVQP
jgi:hypothetical protein